jgi:hypothetical protein
MDFRMMFGLSLAWTRSPGQPFFSAGRPDSIFRFGFAGSKSGGETGSENDSVKPINRNQLKTYAFKNKIKARC